MKSPKKAYSSKRYTAPTKTGRGPSHVLIPVLMFGLFFLGVAVIVLNYFDNAPLLPGPSSQRNLLVGLGLLTAGFVTSTQWR